MLPLRWTVSDQPDDFGRQRIAHRVEAGRHENPSKFLNDASKPLQRCKRLQRIKSRDCNAP
jgi:hypothetical protein